MITFNNLIFDNQKQKDTATSWRNIFDDDIITSSYDMISNYLYYGYFWQYIKNCDAMQEIKNILGTNNLKKIYDDTLDTVANCEK